MLENSTLVALAWTRTTLADGAVAWVRVINDAAGRPLGFVRYQKLAPTPWLFWLRRIRLDVFETDDASHLMTLNRSWMVPSIWNLHDAEDRPVGSLYPKRLVGSDGQVQGYLQLESIGQGRILDPAGQVQARFCTKNNVDLEMTFIPGSSANPFLRMLMLGCLLTLDPKPKGI